MCRSGCKTQDCGSYVACARRVRVAWCDSANFQDATRQKRWDSELQAFRDARAEGLQPDGTTFAKIDAAKRAADTLGAPLNVPSNGHVLDAD